MSHRILLLIMFMLLVAIATLVPVSLADDGNYPGQATSVDQYISWSTGDYDQPTTDTRFAPDPRSSRKLWGQSGEDQSSSDETTATREENNTTAEQSPPVEVETVPAEQAVSDAESTQAAGSWSVSLSGGSSGDAPARLVDLILVQSGDLVFGHGTARTEDITQLVSAVGSVTTGLMSLDLISAEPAEVYRLTLDTEKRPATGSYTAYSSLGASWSGDASAEVSG